jgi:uncharacterized protein (DUF2147 family)
MIRGLLVAALAAFAASAHAGEWRDPSGHEIAKLKQAADMVLKDAASARYKAMTAKESLDGKTVVVCGFFNAKNSYGGYAGYEPFIYSTGDNVFRSGSDTTSMILIDAICGK